MLRRIPTDEADTVVAAQAVPSYSKCMELLVNNSIAAGSTEIRIVVDLSKELLSVHDNGNGISIASFGLIGQRYRRLERLVIWIPLNPYSVSSADSHDSTGQCKVILSSMKRLTTIYSASKHFATLFPLCD